MVGSVEAEWGGGEGEGDGEGEGEYGEMGRRRGRGMGRGSMERWGGVDLLIFNSLCRALVSPC